MNAKVKTKEHALGCSEHSYRGCTEGNNCPCWCHDDEVPDDDLVPVETKRSKSSPDMNTFTETKAEIIRLQIEDKASHLKLSVELELEETLRLTKFAIKGSGDNDDSDYVAIQLAGLDAIKKIMQQKQMTLSFGEILEK